MTTLNVIIGCFVYAIGMTAGIIIGMHYISKIQIKRDKQKFKEDKIYLEMCIESCLLNELSAKYIIEKINEIEQNQERDPEAVYILRNNFRKRFAGILQDLNINQN